jgi:hypothetical protein
VAILDTETLADAVLERLNGEQVPFWVTLYRHRHGIDVGVMYQKDEPSTAEMVATLGSAWEPNHDEEVEARGPYYAPATFAGKLQAHIFVNPLSGAYGGIEIRDTHGNLLPFDCEVSGKNVKT